VYHPAMIGRSMVAVAGVLWLGVLGGCGSTDPGPPPTGLAYSMATATYLVGTAIDPNIPTVSGGVPTSWAVSPALPAGLVLETTSGVISGTPTAGAAQAAYTVTASNGGGSTTATISLTVIGPPTQVTYSTSRPSYLVGEPIEPNVPTVAGGTPTQFVVIPVLPAGLSMDAVTGVITGTPTEMLAQSTFRVTASNAAGAASVNLRITVTATAVSCAIAENASCMEWNEGFGGDVQAACGVAGGRIQPVACSTADRVGRCTYAYSVPGPYTVTVSYYPGAGTAADLEAACHAADFIGGARTTWVAG
jgi:hypothetical protein